MLLAALFMTAALVFGHFVGLAAGFRRKLETTAFSITFGMLCASWLVFLFSLPLGFSETSICATIFILLLLSAALKRYVSLSDAEEDERVGSVSVIAAAAIFSIFAFLNLTTVFVEGSDGVYMMEDAWADHGLHIHIITSFVYGKDFPPPYPVLVNTPLAYPFMADFISAIFLKLGFSLRASLVVPNLFLSLALVSVCLLFAEEVLSPLGKRRAPAAATRATALSLLLFFLNGNAGCFYFFKDVLLGCANPLLRDYSHLETHSLHFENAIEHFFISQRGFLLGFPTAFLALTLLFRSTRSDTENARNMLLAGVLVGLLPFVYIHSFLVVVFVASFLFVLEAAKGVTQKRQRSNGSLSRWLYFFLPVLVLGMPQILWMSCAVQKESFIRLQLGWAPENAGSLSRTLWFWIKNVPVALLAIPGFLLVERRFKIFYVPFLLLFVVGNIVKFQPNPWDNNKIFLHWLFVTVVLAAAFLVELSRLRSGVLFSAVLVTLCTLSGVLSVVYASNAYLFYSNAELEVAEWIKANTEPGSLFLTGFSHKHPVALTGRPVVMGCRGWLFSHGMPFQEVEKDVREIYRSGSMSLLAKYGVRYVFVSAYEKELMQDADSFSQLELVYDEQNFRIYKVPPPTAWNSNALIKRE
ncbi:MAG: putative membrane glycosyltransferase [Candidatus Alkanophagales archaeon MCA70_species_2]|nr:putative membrane glycosyltransferase [Candidatus Alkanophaga liquidiphilum]